MKKLIMITSLLVSSSFAADLSQVSTEELAQEMQKRMQSMTPQERQQYKGSGMMGMGNMGKCGQGMGKMRPNRMQMPDFTEYDLNNDGVLLEKEFEEARAKRMSEHAQEGKMLRNAGNAPSFADIDVNKDGKVDPSEFQTHQQQMRMKNKSLQGKCGQGMGKMRPNRMQMPDFSEYDLNNDGVLLEKEFEEARAKRMSERAQEGKMLRNAGNGPSFADIDVNKDGKVDPSEFQTHQQQMRMKQ